jgi:hypothetical protein
MLRSINECLPRLGKRKKESKQEIKKGSNLKLLPFLLLKHYFIIMDLFIVFL